MSPQPRSAAMAGAGRWATPWSISRIGQSGETDALMRPHFILGIRRRPCTRDLFEYTAPSTDGRGRLHCGARLALAIAAADPASEPATPPPPPPPPAPPPPPPPPPGCGPRRSAPLPGAPRSAGPILRLTQTLRRYAVPNPAQLTRQTTPQCRSQGQQTTGLRTLVMMDDCHNALCQAGISRHPSGWQPELLR